MIAAEQVTASVVTRVDELEALEDAWNALLDQAVRSHFNMRPLWQLAWWRHFGDGASLRAVVCRDAGGALIGLAPLYLTAWRTGDPACPSLSFPDRQDCLSSTGGGELRFIGCTHEGPANGRATVIARRGDEAAVASALAACLQEQDDWTRLWLAQIASDDPIIPLLAEALGPGTRIAANPPDLWVETIGDWETYRKSLGKSGRKRVQRYGRAAAAHGVVFRCATSMEEVMQVFELYLQWHAALLQGEGVYEDPRGVAFLRELVVNGVPEGRVQVRLAELDGAIAAADFVVVDRGVVYPYQGHVDRRFAHFRLGHILASRLLQDCFDDPHIHSVILGQPAVEKRFWTSRECTTSGITHERLCA